ncbi:LacI family DNA-binding transcriptional regulator [Aeromicrobium sp.]|uniref:LacI family DNA-binding transcriptional regulator n=1 Tax=Aeromicrobium sp. TaxID=1871063 RepID=UPI002FC960CC
MSDVAALAGVDTSVVSRVINGDERLLVRPETRQRVLDAIDRLGYRPNIAARMLKTSRTMAIGLVIPDFANASHAQIAIGAEQRANDAGYILLVASGAAEHRLAQLHGRVDGLLYAIATGDPAAPVQLPEGIPCLLVNRREPHLGPSVIGNDEASAEVATQHLIDLGHRRIAHLVVNVPLDTGNRRTAGYLRAMSNAGLPVPPELGITTDVDEIGGYKATLELLHREPRPTALLIATSRWAMGALAACDELGVRVPEDLSIVAFSDTPIGEFMHPALTTVELPLRAMGVTAVEMLLRLIDDEDVADVELDELPRLTQRASTAPPPPD